MNSHLETIVIWLVVIAAVVIGYQIFNKASAQQQALDEAARLRAEELPLLRRDAQLAPDAGVIQYRYGLAEYLAQDFKRAREAMTRACELEPDNEQFRLGLTLLLERLGDLPAARASAAELLRLAPQNPAYREILNRLR